MASSPRFFALPKLVLSIALKISRLCILYYTHILKLKILGTKERRNKSVHHIIIQIAMNVKTTYPGTSWPLKSVIHPIEWFRRSNLVPVKYLCLFDL